MKIRESAEMYLETILVLSKQGPVRSIDIAKKMNFSRPSVSVMIHDLEDENYLTMCEDGTIRLEKKGLEIAEKIYERHSVLSMILEKIGVPKEIAVEDACKIEHDISDKTFDCIKKTLKRHKSLDGN